MDQTFKPKGLPMIRRLHFLAIRKIFDRQNFNKIEEYELSMGIEKYMLIVDYISPMDREDLHRIVDCLLADEEVDFFHKQKFLIKKHGLNVYNLYRNGLPFIELYRPIIDSGSPVTNAEDGGAV